MRRGLLCHNRPPHLKLDAVDQGGPAPSSTPLSTSFSCPRQPCSSLSRTPLPVLTMASLSLHQCHLLRPLPLLFLHPDRICYRAPLAELVKHGAQSAASRSQDAAKKKELALPTFPRHEVRSSSSAQEALSKSCFHLFQRGGGGAGCTGRP